MPSSYRLRFERLEKRDLLAFNVVADVNESIDGTSPRSPVQLGDEFFFCRRQQAYGNQWALEIRPGVWKLHSRLHWYWNRILGKARASQVSGDMLYFAVYDPLAVEWTSDGTAEGTHPLPSENFFQSYLATSQDFWFSEWNTAWNTNEFSSVMSQYGWTSFDSIASSGPYNLDGTVLFLRGRTNSVAIWTTDGTPAGTQYIELPDDVFFRETRLVAGGKLYFTAYDKLHGHELWVTDGTEVGTHLVRDIMVGPDSSEVDRFYGVEDGTVVYFNATTAALGRELWRTDGTAEGTYLVADIAKNEESSGAIPLWYSDGTLVFSAHTVEYGREIWATDGTVEGTRLVEDVEPGQGDGFSIGRVAGVVGSVGDPNHGIVLINRYRPLFVNGDASAVSRIEGEFPIFYSSIEFDGKVLLSAKNEFGGEIWVTDGTTSGIKRLPLAPEFLGARPSFFKQIGESLFFNANGFF